MTYYVTHLPMKGIGISRLTGDYTTVQYLLHNVGRVEDGLFWSNSHWAVDEEHLRLSTKSENLRDLIKYLGELENASKRYFGVAELSDKDFINEVIRVCL